MAKLSSTDIYGDLYVDGIISGVLSGSVSNNLIVKLNGGTTEGTNQFTFNGSAAKTVNITPSSIGAAASSHNHGLLHDNHTVTIANTTTDSGWSMINSSYNGFILKSIRTNANAPTWLCNDFSAGVAFGGSDTKGVLSCAYNYPSIKIAGGNGSKPVWWVGLTGTTGTSYDLNRINTAYTHSQAAHAPSNAQKNSDITKAEIEAKLTGTVTSHNHSGTYAPASHGTHLTIGTGASNAAAGNHTHNAIVSRGNVTCESGVAGRPAVSGLSMSQAYNNGYPTPYGNIINLRGTGDGQILVGWSGTDGAHAPVYVRSKRDNTSTANWSGWAQIYTSANPQTTMNGLSLWKGTQAQYDAISSKSSTTLYFITG